MNCGYGQIDKVLPWGRSMAEYERMFALTDADLPKRILGCGDGPASFNAEWSARGGHVVSVDPLYIHSAEAIRGRIDEARKLIVENTLAHVDAYVWSEIKSIEELVRLRLGAMNRFLDDYESNNRTGRYIAGCMPDLPFPAGSFDLALCSHFLFTYSEQFSGEQHVAFIESMLAIASEVRVFPLLDMNGLPSPHLEPVKQAFRDSGYVTRIEPVLYEYQNGGNQMLRLFTHDVRASAARSQ